MKIPCSPSLWTLEKPTTLVPREALWQVLERCGVPPGMLKVVKSFHVGMQAVVRVGATLSDSFEVRNGLRQGCTCSYTFRPLLQCSGSELARGLCRGWSGCPVSTREEADW